MSDGGARILDRGYRAYDGPRGGTVAAIRAVASHTAIRCLGLRRSFWAKAFPTLVAFIAFAPALVLVGLAVIGPSQALRDVVGYESYYGLIMTSVVVFTAFVTPEALGPDRRSGLLGLYLAAPLTRTTYLVAKALGVLAVLAVVTVGPVLLLLIGQTFLGVGPDGLIGWLGTLARIVGAGVLLAGLFTAIGLAVAGMTDRRAVAAAAIVLFLLVAGAAASVVVHGLDGPGWVLVFHPMGLAEDAVRHLHGAGPLPGATAYLGATISLLAAGAWTLAASVVVWARYQRLAVTR